MRQDLRREQHYGDRVVRCYAERPGSIDAMFRRAVETAPDQPALIDDNGRTTYAQLAAVVERLAAGLAAQGLKKGDRIAFLANNRAEFVWMVLAAARLGLIFVPLNTRQRKPEIEHVLTDCGAKAMIIEASCLGELPDRSATPSLTHVFVIDQDGGDGFQALLAKGPPPAAAKVAEEDGAYILYTSGTTGKPKGAVLTHFGVIHSILHFREGFQLGAGEIAMLAVPASHVTGLVAIILPMIGVAGATVIAPPFKARLFIEQAAREGMTYTLMVPAMYNLCLLDPTFREADLSRWRVGGFGGAPMPPDTIDRLAEVLPGLRLQNVYGSTETTSPATMLAPTRDKERLTSVGTALPCVELMIADDDGRELPPGETGEVWIAGPNVSPGYWNNPTGTASSFVAGFWKSGDIGSLDESGHLRVFDRKKDMINRGGFKIYSIEVENVLMEHADVVEAAVFGTPDPVLGERVRAVVFRHADAVDAETLIRHCAERLSDYKVPESVVFLTEPLPRNANGKVLKVKLREAALAAAS